MGIGEMPKKTRFDVQMTAFELLCHLTCNCVHPTHLHENISKLLDHWDDIPQTDRRTAREYVLKNGNEEQKRRLGGLK
jgi:hypothetical protein